MTGLLFLCVTAGHSDGKVFVTIAHNDNGSASAGFHFNGVAAPRRSAALFAEFSLVDGGRDPNGANLEALHDGGLPDEQDQPEANFFFKPASDGGRILVDLRKVTAIKEIDSYSWHPGVRGPQFYQLYGSDGTGNGFVMAPKRPQDPSTCRWNLIASVDTRPRQGAPGGQYAASIADSAGAALGAYRYLLFDIHAADANDISGNTFYSQIVILSNDASTDATVGALLSGRLKDSTTYNENGYQLRFDNDNPSFDPNEKKRLVETFFTVYPKLVAAFNPEAPKNVRISVETRYKGVAATSNSTIHMSAIYMDRHPADIDVITHEATHVVQQYKQYDPIWLVEGIADYARYKFGVDNADAGWSLPPYSSNQKYTDSYRVTARFLAWLEVHVAPGIVQKLDSALRASQYTPETWQQITGKSLDQLWQDYSKNPAL